MTLQSRSRTLVTGASGFIARHALEPIVRAGHEVIASTLVPPDEDLRHLAPHAITWRTDDLLAPGRAAELIDAVRPTHLLHAAWNAAPGKFWTAPDNERWLDVSLDLFTAFARAGGRRAVGVGTCAEYDWTALGDAPIKEHLTPRGRATLYARAKSDLLDRATDVFDRAVPPVSFAWARIFFLFGPHEHPDRLAAGLIRSMLLNHRAQCRSPGLVRDFIDSRDAGRALAELMLSGATGPVNIASGLGVSLGDFARCAARACGREDLLDLGNIMPADQPARLVADVTRLYDEVGFRPRYPLEPGLRDAVAWWRERLELTPMENG